MGQIPRTLRHDPRRTENARSEGQASARGGGGGESLRGSSHIFGRWCVHGGSFGRGHVFFAASRSGWAGVAWRRSRRRGRAVALHVGHPPGRRVRLRAGGSWRFVPQRRAPCAAVVPCNGSSVMAMASESARMSSLHSSALTVNSRSGDARPCASTRKVFRSDGGWLAPPRG